ncbi:Uncharacterised protein [Sebaldella termitidis]|uniref:Uncharacterized protein n=1 Tax=Sebaldella termitidis (strain ATCC 33386 / NCTC 11300) TaxID=526218 RepID=D1AN74_SEBTE|nr:hypothetical protein [Sebaldella termitidis]ACZ09678.1 hypothetical protein Sterm_2834 [Sebaldella termitidis ATCC 33386]SUI25010.1 Uncharacterised protein [Sebaldella termitidis]
MGVSIEDIRRGIIELETKEVDGSYTYQMSDDDIQHYINQSEVMLSDVEGIESIKDILEEYLSKHLVLINIDRYKVNQFNLPENSTNFIKTSDGLGFDQTVFGQQFKVLIRPYTEKFENTDDLAKLPQNFLNIYS